MRALLLVAGLACLSGCATTRNQVAPQLVPAADVIRQVKYEIGKFAWQTREVQTNASTCLAAFQLIVSKADIDLTTTTSSSTDVSAGAQVPINIVKLGIGGSVSSGRSNTQSLHLVVVPQPYLENGPPAAPTNVVWQGEPLYGAMMDVYKAIIAASDQRPCVGFDDDNSVSFGFSAERKASVNGSLGLFVLSLGADHSSGGSAAHSVTLHFHAGPHAVGATAPTFPEPQFAPPEAPPPAPKPEPK